MAPPTAEHLQSLRAQADIASAGGQEYEDHIRHIIKVLGSLSEKDLATAANAGLLDTLDPALDSLPYAYILQARVKQSLSGRQLSDDLHVGNALWQQLATFMKTTNSVQMRYIGNIWSYFVDILCASSHYCAPGSTEIASAIAAGVAALLHLDPKTSTLTSHHLTLARLALASSASRACLPLLDNDITEVPSKTPANPDQLLRSDLSCPSTVYISGDPTLGHKFSLFQVQEYLMLAALNYIAVQQWTRATSCLDRVLVTPCNGNPNGLMVEAYKKWMLLNLLTSGKPCGFPRATSDKTRKTLRGAAKPYESVADAFVLTEYRRLLAEVDEGSSLWADDCNTGLIQRVLADHQRRTVGSLAKTYVSLPMDKVAALLKMEPQQTSLYLGRLIQTGALHARLVQSQAGMAVLSFTDEGGTGAADKPESALRAELMEQTQRIQVLEQEMQEADHALSMSKSYLDSVRRYRNRKAEAGPGGEEPGELFAPGESEDEDVMGEA